MMVTRKLGVAALVLLVSGLVAAQLAQARPTRSAGGAAASASLRTSGATCALGANGNPVKHVIYLQFDNVHYRRDAAGVPSDLEQMPHLLQFLQGNGTLLTNDHTILISHTAGGILSSLTGLYPDRNGQTVTNSYGFFKPDGTVGFSSAFKYWTDQVDATADPLPNMITDGQKTTPAPWVPFTRAGCDVGGVGTANIELENTATNATGDMTRVFGTGSPEWTEASDAAALPSDFAHAKAKGQPLTDFVGIAVHCSNSSTSVCAGNANAHPDALPDEPGGYDGYNALFGAKYVDPAITAGQPCVNDTAGQPITDASGTCGFPGFDGMLARNTLGYVEQMQESGVPITYGYISDVHDAHAPNPATDSYVSTATGPGEAAHDAQLKDYDDAFAAFFQNLAAHGIDKSNTLFVITVDEGDHFTGGAGIAQPDGTLAYAHTACAVLNACPSNQIGEVNANMQALLPAGEPPFSIHSDDAPTVYVNGHPGPTDPTVRKLERDVAALQAPDPYVANGQTVPMMVNLADPVEEQALHMVNSDGNRTPTFTLFGNDDFFFTTSDASFGSPNQCAGVHLCAVPSFAWNHGDVQQEIGNTWAGIVGPGVANRGVDSQTWTDHTNLRPTILALTGLSDDYAHDGRVLVEALRPRAVPRALRSPFDTALGQTYEQLNAPFGAFAQDTLAASTRAIASGSATDDAQYTRTDATIQALTARRDALARRIEGQLDGAAFGGRRIPPIEALVEGIQAKLLIAAAHGLAQHAS
jgi:hypothetical protein